MADFALLIEAAAPGLGWESGEFLRVFEANRVGAIQVAIENSTMAQALTKFIWSLSDPAGFRGTAAELLAKLESAETTTEAMKRSRDWPRRASELGTQVQRIAPALRATGIGVEQHRVGAERRRELHIFRRRE